MQQKAKMQKKGSKKINFTHFSSGQKKFKIGENGAIDTTMADIRRQMREDMAKNAISLKSELKISSDFYTPEEAKGFKKRKRKVKKTRKGYVFRSTTKVVAFFFRKKCHVFNNYGVG